MSSSNFKQYFGSGNDFFSDPDATFQMASDPAPDTYGICLSKHIYSNSFRIRSCLDPDRRIRLKVSDPTGSGFTTLISSLFRNVKIPVLF